MIQFLLSYIKNWNQTTTKERKDIDERNYLTSKIGIKPQQRGTPKLSTSNYLTSKIGIKPQLLTNTGGMSIDYLTSKIGIKPQLIH